MEPEIEWRRIGMSQADWEQLEHIVLSYCNDSKNSEQDRRIFKAVLIEWSIEHPNAKLQDE